MTSLVPACCAIPGQTAAKAALIRRIEAASRANEDRQDAPRGQHAHTKTTSAGQPMAAVAAQILGAQGGAPNAFGYGSYDKAARLLTQQSHVVDVKLG